MLRHSLWRIRRPILAIWSQCLSQSTLGGFSCRLGGWVAHHASYKLQQSHEHGNRMRYPARILGGRRMLCDTLAMRVLAASSINTWLTCEEGGRAGGGVCSPGAHAIHSTYASPEDSSCPRPWPHICIDRVISNNRTCC